MNGPDDSLDSLPSPRFRPVEERDFSFSRAAYPVDSDAELGFDDWDSEYDYEPDWIDRARARIARGLVRLGWFGLALALAFGAAGIVGSQQRLAESGNQPQLTYGADQALLAKLDQAVRPLALLNDDVESLDSAMQNVFTSLAQANQDSLQKAWNSGANAILDLSARAAVLENLLGCRNWTATANEQKRKTYSAGVIEKYDLACAGAASVAPLPNDWEALVAGSRTSMEVANDLTAHDLYAEQALILATEGKYSEAIAQLRLGSAAIDGATTIAENKALFSDVSTLQTLLIRTKELDEALVTLWNDMIESKGVLTPKVAAALKAVNSAKALLSNDTGAYQTSIQEMAMSLYAYRLNTQTASGGLVAALNALTAGIVYSH